MLYEVVGVESGMEMEMDTVGTPTPVYYNIGEEYYEEWLPNRQMLRLTGQPGSAIASTARA